MESHKIQDSHFANLQESFQKRINKLLKEIEINPNGLYASTWDDIVNDIHNLYTGDKAKHSDTKKQQLKNKTSLYILVLVSCLTIPDPKGHKNIPLSIYRLLQPKYGIGNDTKAMEFIFKTAASIQDQEKNRSLKPKVLKQYLRLIKTNFDSSYPDELTHKNSEMYILATQLCNFEEYNLWQFIPDTMFNSKDFCLNCAKMGCLDMLENEHLSPLVKEENLIKEVLLSQTKFTKETEREQAEAITLKFIDKLNQLYKIELEATTDYDSDLEFILNNKAKLMNFIKVFGYNAILYLESLLVSSPLPIERFFASYHPIDNETTKILSDIFTNINQHPNKTECGEIAGLISIINGLTEIFQFEFINQLKIQNQIYSDNKKNKNTQLKELEGLNPEEKKEKFKELKESKSIITTISMNEFITWLHNHCLNSFLSYLGINKEKIDTDKLDNMSIERLLQLAEGVSNLEMGKHSKYINMLVEMISADLSNQHSFSDFIYECSEEKSILSNAIAKHNSNCISELKKSNINLEKALNYNISKTFCHDKTKFTVKQWDKNDINTIFLGNFLSCCIATNNFAFHAILERRIDVACFMHVIINETTKEPIAGMWLYFAKSDDEQIIVTVNYVEMKNNYTRNQELRDELLRSLCRYLDEYCINIGAKEFVIRPLTYGSLPDFKLQEGIIRPGLNFEIVKMKIKKVGGYFDITSMKTTDKVDTYYLESEKIEFFYRPPQMNALQSAVEYGEIDKVREYLSDPDLDIDAKDSYGRTALHIAVQYHHVGIIVLLLINGANPGVFYQGDNCITSIIKSTFKKNKNYILELLLKSINNQQINKRNIHGFSALELAIQTRDIKLVNLLLNSGANPLLFNPDLGNAVFYATKIACMTNDLEILALILEYVPHPNESIYEDGSTPISDALCFAIKSDRINLVKLLLKFKADPSFQICELEAPLNYANFNNLGMVKLLLEYGAFSNIEIEINKKIISPLYHVFKMYLDTKDSNKRNELLEIITLLIKNRADVNEIPNKADGKSLLTLAINSEDNDLIFLLLNEEANICLQDIHGKTPFHHAVIQWSTDILNHILTNNTQCDIKNFINIQDSSGKTALHYAILKGDADLRNLILDAGADVNIQDNKGNTPLHYAVMSKKEIKVVSLLVKNPDKNIQNNEGDTPLHCAVDTTYNFDGFALMPSAGLAKVLVKNGAKLDIKNKRGRTPYDIAHLNGEQALIDIVNPGLSNQNNLSSSSSNYSIFQNTNIKVEKKSESSSENKNQYK